MLEDTQKLRLITAAAKLQQIIVTCEIDQDYQAFLGYNRSVEKTPLDLVQNPKDAGAERPVSKDHALQSQSDDEKDLFTSLVQTIHGISELVDQHSDGKLSKPLIQKVS